MSKGLRVFGLLLVCGLLFWLWHYQRAFDPALDYYEAWRSARDEPTPDPLQLTGTVVRVFDGANLRVQESGGRLWSLRLAGLVAPNLLSPQRAEKARAEASRDHLTRLVLSNEVVLEIGVSNLARSAIAVLRLGPTNVNASLIADRQAILQPDYFGGLSVRSRYELLQAHRLARRHAPGIVPETP